MGSRGYALVRTADQWRRAAHRGTMVDATTGEVSLSWLPTAPAARACPPGPLAGLAFDSACRLHRSDPGAGRVLRSHWSPDQDHRAGDEVAIVAEDGPPAPGEFAPAAAAAPLGRPGALAIDAGDRLYVADEAGCAVIVIGLWPLRTIRRVPLGGVPLDLAADGHAVLAVVDAPPRLLRVGAHADPQPVAVPTPSCLPEGATVRRVAVALDGAAFLLFRAPGGDGCIVPLDRPEALVRAPRPRDLEVAGDGAVVVSLDAEADLRRYREGLADRPLAAAHDSGSGLVRCPDGQVAFWTAAGLRDALPARRRFRTRGRVTTYALDAGDYGTRWGRLFVDACIHEGSEILVRCTTADEPPEGPTLERTPPENATGPVPRRMDLSPPLPPRALLPGDGEGFRRLHRRETGIEVAWLRRGGDDPVATYDAPVNAPPGRFLWVEIEMIGTGSRSPRLVALRAERPGHDLLRRLPRNFSREAPVASFLQRYLATLEGDLDDLAARAEERRVLLDPRIVPEELLPWLASFLGLVLDERWPARARRTLVAEAAGLFARRGTVAALTRLMEIYLGVAPVLVEHYRLRGLGARLGIGASAAARSVLGGGLRLGGPIDAGGPAAPASGPGGGLGRAAHRFTVLVPADLDPIDLSVVGDLLDQHRPAHTVVDVCTMAAEIRVGRGLHVAVSSVVGRDSGFGGLHLGERLGQEVLGRPGVGTAPGAGRLGRDTRVG
jgi:phage tail-like protein